MKEEFYSHEFNEGTDETFSLSEPHEHVKSDCNRVKETHIHTTLLSYEVRIAHTAEESEEVKKLY